MKQYEAALQKIAILGSENERLAVELEHVENVAVDAIARKRTLEKEIKELKDELARCSLTDGQKAALGLEKLKGIIRKPGQPKKLNGEKIPHPVSGNKSAKQVTKEIAEALGTSVKSIQQMQAIEHRAPELAAEVRSGTKSINRAATEARMLQN
jgi:hypothetical protein